MNYDSASRLLLGTSGPIAVLLKEIRDSNLRIEGYLAGKRDVVPELDANVPVGSSDIDGYSITREQIEAAIDRGMGMHSLAAWGSDHLRRGHTVDLIMKLIAGGSKANGRR